MSVSGRGAEWSKIAEVAMDEDMGKKVIHIFHKPSGLGDLFSKEMESALCEKGLNVRINWLWPSWLYHGLCCRRFSWKFRLHILHDVLVTIWHRKCLHNINKGDIVIVDGDSKVRPDTRCWFEKKLVKKGADYIFYLIDDLLSVGFHREGIQKRIEMASAVIAVTPQLKKRVQKAFPDKQILLLEEPIDAERVGQVIYPDGSGRVSVAWTGRMLRAKKMVDIIREAKGEGDFDFRVVTGTRRPKMGFPFDWSWMPFCHDHESDSFRGCVAGLANLENTSYDACKGNYKVKTYMAMGLCPIVSDVGYARNLIEHGKTGFLVSTEKGWVDAIRFVVQNPDQAIEMGQCARSFIVNTYAAEPLARAWAEQLNICLDM